MLAIPEPDAFAVRLGLGTGLRWAELCRAQASNVEQGVLVVSQTKTGKVRRVPLAQTLLAEVRVRVGKLVSFNEAQPSHFSRRVRRLSGVSRFHPHQMRHTFACRWLEAGGSLPALQQILGHSSVAMTQHYGKLGDEAVREQAERVWGSEDVAISVAAALLPHAARVATTSFPAHSSQNAARLRSSSST